jgi:hypothetical protein
MMNRIKLSRDYIEVLTQWIPIATENEKDSWTSLAECSAVAALLEFYTRLQKWQAVPRIPRPYHLIQIRISEASALLHYIRFADPEDNYFTTVKFILRIFFL